MYSYSEGPYREELYEEFGDLLEKHDFLPDRAGVERLGREAGRLVVANDRNVILGILQDERLAERLPEDMGGMVDENEALLAAYIDGFGQPADG